MKKGLSLVLSTAMAVSMFASVAMAETATTTTTTTNAATEAAKVKTSADFKDLSGISAELKTKIDALLAKGIFDGVTEDSFGIDQNMTRAQAAKVLTLIYGIKVDDSVKTSSFSDVKTDDAANGWAIPYIEAAKKAGLVDGVTDTTFVPGQNVTLGQFATMLVKGLGKTVDVTGTPWYKDAVAQAIALKILPEGTDGAKAATRGDLVVGAFGGKAAYDQTQTLTGEAKQAGVTKVEVKFNKAVDDTKAQFDLKRGSTVVNVDAKFADDKKSVVLTVKDGLKLLAGEHTLTVKGLDQEITSKFTTEEEKVTKIDFLNAGDTIAFADKVRVAFKAANQFGEAVSMTAGSFSVFATSGDPIIKKTTDGDLFVELKTNGTGLAQGQSQVSINIYDNNRNITASKVFKVGTAPYISKIETRAPRYSVNEKGLTKIGETAKVSLIEYDQYGNVLVQGSGSVVKPTAHITPNFDQFQDVTIDYNSDGVNEAVVKLKKDAESNSDYTLSIYGGTSTATATIKTVAGKVATKIELVNDGSATFAEGDTDKYVTLVAYDANGEKLSQDDIVQNAKDDRFNINVSGSFLSGPTNDVVGTILDKKNQAIVLAGEHKGKIHIKEVKKGPGYIFASIYSQTGASSNTQQTYNVSSPRVPVTIKVNGDELATKAVAGASTETKLKFYDQNDSEFKKLTDKVPVTENSGTVSYNVYVSTPSNEGFTVTLNDVAITMDGKVFETDEVFDKKIKVVAKNGDTLAAVGKKVEVRVALRKKVGDKIVDDSVRVYSKTVTVIDPKQEKLTYALSAPGDLFQVKEDKTITTAEENEVETAHQHKEVKLTAKDSGGNIVAITAADMIDSVTTTNPTVAEAKQHPENKKIYVMGAKAGTSTLAVTFKNAKGEYEQLTTDVTVKSDAVVVSTITSKATKTVLRSDITKTDGINSLANKLMELKVTDNYGISYNHDAKIDRIDGGQAEVAYDAIKAFDKHLAVRYGISNVNDGATAADITIDQETGKITIDSKVTSFTLTAYAGSKSTQTAVIIK